MPRPPPLSFPTRRSSDLVDLEQHRAVRRADLHGDARAARRIAGRVVDQVAHQQRQRRGVATALTLLRSEEHTSELQSQFQLVCRLVLEKKKEEKCNEGQL